MVDIVSFPRPRRATTPAAAPRPAVPAGDWEPSPRHGVALGLIGIAGLVLGAWLLGSHYVLGYPFVEGAEDAFFNEALVGIIVLCAGYGRLQSPCHLPKLTALQALAGAWLVAAPWAVAYGEEVPTARANDVLCGLIALILAGAGAWWAHLARRDAARAMPLPPEAAQSRPLEHPAVPRRNEAPAGRLVTHGRS
jgi:hypothetical protein